jgi:uncharacterized membrane protein YczE
VSLRGDRESAPAYLLQLRDELDALEASRVGRWPEVVIGVVGLLFFVHTIVFDGPVALALIFFVVAGGPLVRALRTERERQREMRAIQARIDRIEGRDR